MQLNLFNVEPEIEIPEGQESWHCIGCKRTLPRTDQFFPRNTNNAGKLVRFKHICKDCMSEQQRMVAYLKKTAPPVPDCCDNCGRDFSTISKKDVHLDHCHDKGTFRGWLCKPCNVGIGMLGDDIAGLERAIDYLRKTDERT